MHPTQTSQTRSAGRACVGKLLVAFLLIGAVGCRGERQEAAPESASPPSSASTADPKSADPDHPVVRIDTNVGAITLRLDAERAPGTVRNFLQYVTTGFYSDTLFHFVDPDNMILAGGYTVDHQLKPGYAAIRSEVHNGLRNVRGTVAMARDRALIDSATSQFFINLADAPQRDHQGNDPEEHGYCVFGEVIGGLDVAERISRSPTQDFGGDMAQTPQPPVVIKAVRVL